MVDHFRSQFDGCVLCGGKHMDGLNCGPAAEAMFLYRATQGRVDVSSCHVRDLMNDCVDGTNFAQAKAVSAHYGVTVGALWQPGKLAALKPLLLTGRYPMQISIGYKPLIGTPNDCFRGQFDGAHRIYVKDANEEGIRYGDPGANGRSPGIPYGWQSMSWTMFGRVTGALPLTTGGLTLNADYGTGYVFAYIGPADPLVPVQRWKVSINTGSALIRFPLLDHPFGTKQETISRATYICTAAKLKNPAGVPYTWYRIVSKTDGSHTDNAGLYFTPNRYVKAVPA